MRFRGDLRNFSMFPDEFQSPSCVWPITAVLRLFGFIAFKAGKEHTDRVRFLESIMLRLTSLIIVLLIAGANVFQTKARSIQFISNAELQAAVQQCTDDWQSSHCANIGDWDVSLITDMTGLFAPDSGFNLDISGWNNSNVASMSGIFNSASSFNQRLDAWDMSRVTDTSYMFYQATSFNQPVNSWDMSRATTASNMLSGASSFNQPLNSWDMSSAVDTSHMSNPWILVELIFNQPFDAVSHG